MEIHHLTGFYFHCLIYNFTFKFNDHSWSSSYEADVIMTSVNNARAMQIGEKLKNL